MSNLITQSTQIPGLTVSESKIVHAANSPMIRDTKNIDMKKIVSLSIEKANRNMGQGKMMDINDMKFLTDSVVEYLREKYQFLTLEEFSHALRYGSMGEFKKDGETLYMSAEKIASWIRSYLELKKRPVMAKVANMARLPEVQSNPQETVKDPEVQNMIADIKQSMEKMATKGKVEIKESDSTETEAEREAALMNARKFALTYLEDYKNKK